MKIFGLYVFTGKSLGQHDKRIGYDGESRGFQNAVVSLVKAIESKDKIILGNGTTVNQSTINSPLTIVGNNQCVSSNVFNNYKATKFTKPLLTLTGTL